jgi:hypothetical protein
VSHADVDSEVLFWFVLALTVLLVTMIGAVIRLPPGSIGSPQRPESGSTAPPRPGLAGWPPAAGLARATVPPGRAGYRPRHAGGIRSEVMVADRRQVPGCAPWRPAPRPRTGAHRQAPRHGARRARMSPGQVRGSAGRTGRHRAGGH